MSANPRIYTTAQFYITVTGASFLVLNGALKSSSGLSAKSSIVEDGIMVQVSQDRMMEIRKALNKMTDVKIDCGPVAANEIEAPDETVYIKWTDKNPSINSGYMIKFEFYIIAWGYNWFIPATFVGRFFLFLFCPIQKKKLSRRTTYGWNTFDQNDPRRA